MLARVRVMTVQARVCVCGGVHGFLKDERRYEAADYWVDHSVGSFVRGPRDTDQDAAREPREDTKFKEELSLKATPACRVSLT